MTLTPRTREVLAWLISSGTLDRLPDQQHIDIGCGHQIQLQCRTRDAARKVRTVFGAGSWHKEYRQECNWWEFTTTLPNGMIVCIYACQEAPPTCRAVEEEISVVENVPVAWEQRTVTKKVIRWDCPDERHEAAGGEA